MTGSSAPVVRSIWSRIAWSAVGLYAVLVFTGLWLQASVATIRLADVWVFFALLWAAAIGALIVARLPRHPVGWLFIAVALSFATGLVTQQYAIHAIVYDPGSLPAGELAAWVSFWITMPGVAGIALFLPLLFPDGHLPSARWRPVAWLSGVLLVVAVAATMAEPNKYAEYPNIRNPLGIDAWADAFALWDAVSEAMLLTLVLLSSTALLYRLRRAGPEERLQIRWFAFAVAIVVVAFVVDVLARLAPVLTPAGQFLAVISVTALPSAAGIAILRYRLYEIDVIINRTVVYVSLTAVLAGLYAAAVALFQRIIVVITGESSDVAVVLTLFVLATVFTPIKNTLQSSADRYLKPVARPSPAAESTAIDDLVRLAELHSRGILTDDEFAAKKKQVLGL